MGQRCLVEDCIWVLVNYGVLRRSRFTASTVVRQCSKTVVLTTYICTVGLYYGTVVGIFFAHVYTGRATQLVGVRIYNTTQRYTSHHRAMAQYTLTQYAQLGLRYLVLNVSVCLLPHFLPLCTTKQQKSNTKRFSATQA